MSWTVMWRDIFTPIVLIGLFTMNFITLFIAIRREKRDTKRNRENIVRNAKQIARNYKLLKEASRGHVALEKKQLKQNLPMN